MVSVLVHVLRWKSCPRQYMPRVRCIEEEEEEEGKEETSRN